MSTCPAAVRRPCASTVNVDTFVAVPYEPAVTAVLASFAGVTAPSAMSDVPTAPGAILAVVTASSAILALETAPSASLAVLTAPVAIVGFGYVPARSPPAVPVGLAPLIVTLLAAVRRPCASTVNCATCVALP